MPSIISASTASNTALNLSADTSGVLEIRTGSSPTTALTIDASQNATFANVINGNGSGITSINAANVSSGVLAQARGGTGTTTGYYGFKNRIINGAMVIDQRNAGAGVSVNNAAVYTLDRWQAHDVTDGVYTVQRSTNAPTGFINSLLVTTTTADSSLAAGEYAFVTQPIEGLNIADLGWGTASASTVTLSFWVRSSLTGTFGGSLRNGAGNRSYPFNYTVSSANTWEQKSITIAGDTTGTWLTDNGIGILPCFGLGVGSTFSGTAGAWSGSNFLSATGSTNVLGTLNATWQITGVQLEVGTTATSFDYRPYGTELALCQRYTYSLFSPGGGNYFLATGGSFGSATNGFISLNFPQVMRATPSLSPTPTAGNYQVYLPNGGTYQTLTSISLNGVSTNNFALLNFGIASGGTAGQVCYLNSPSSASPIIFSAEL